MTADQPQNGHTQSPSLVEAIDRLADELDDVHRHDPHLGAFYQHLLAKGTC